MNISFGYAPDTLTRPGDWAHQAACAGKLDEMFPEQPDKAGRQAAIALCSTCPVRTQCLDTALREEGTRGHSDRYGISGGHTPYERWVIAKRRGIRPTRRRYIARAA